MSNEVNKTILTTKEKEFLKNIIAPFENKIDIIGITKLPVADVGYEFILFTYFDPFLEIKKFFTPDFKKGTMFSGMELFREYRLKELEITSKF